MNRIDGNQLSQLQSQAKKADTPAKKADATTTGGNTKGEPTAGAASADSVQISDAGRQLSELEKSMDTRAFNDQKVALIKQAVDDGTYKPDAQVMAQKMLSMDNAQFAEP